MGQKAKRPRREKPQRRGEERRPRSIDSPPPAPPRPLPPFAIARNEKRPSSLRLPSPPLEIEDVGKSRKRKTLNAFENIMNPLESLDVTEEPGFPDLSTTPRSIRNMENLLVTIDKWDSSKPGGETVWDQILKSNKANNKEGTKV